MRRGNKLIGPDDTGRRADIVVLKDGKVHKIYEVTGKHVDKTSQLGKSANLIAGGAYIRRPGARGANNMIRIPRQLRETLYQLD